MTEWSSLQALKRLNSVMYRGKVSFLLNPGTIQNTIRFYGPLHTPNPNISRINFYDTGVKLHLNIVHTLNLKGTTLIPDRNRDGHPKKKMERIRQHGRGAQQGDGDTYKVAGIEMVKKYTVLITSIDIVDMGIQHKFESPGLELSVDTHKYPEWVAAIQTINKQLEPVSHTPSIADDTIEKKIKKVKEFFHETMQIPDKDDIIDAFCKQLFLQRPNIRIINQKETTGEIHIDNMYIRYDSDEGTLSINGEHVRYSPDELRNIIERLRDHIPPNILDALRTELQVITL